MTYPHGGASQIWRDANAHNPRKSEIRDWGKQVEDLLHGKVHITQFGADASGVEDSTSAWNQAIAHLKSLGGGILDLSGGAYLFSTFVTTDSATSHVVINGGGDAIIRTETPDPFEGIFQLSGSHITVRGCRFECDVAGVNKLGIDIVSADNCLITENRFHGLRYAVLGRQASHHNIIGKNFYHSGDHGLTGFILNGEGNQIIDNNIEQFTDTGCGCQGGSKNSVISRNVMKAKSNYATIGIVVEADAENISVLGNIIDGAHSVSSGGLKSGIKIGDNATGTCPKGVIVSSNQVFDVAAYGIFTVNSGSVRDVSDLTVAHNVVRDTGSDNYRFEDVDQALVIGNTSVGAGRHGFYVVANCDGMTIEANLATDSVDTGFVTDNAVNSVVRNNRANGNTNNYNLNRPSESFLFHDNAGLDSGLRDGKQDFVSWSGNLAASGNSGYFHVIAVPAGASIYIDEIQIFEDGNLGYPPNVDFRTNSNMPSSLAGAVTHSPGVEIMHSPIAYEDNNQADEKYVRFILYNTDGASAHDVTLSARYRVMGG